MKNFLARFDLFITPRTWWAMAALFVLFVLSYPFSFLLGISTGIFIAFIIIAGVDLLILILPSKPVIAARRTSDKWSLGDQNKVHITLKNEIAFFWRIKIIDELPVELQVRDFKMLTILEPNEEKTLDYWVKPVKRGLYVFGHIRLFVSSPLGVFWRRVNCEVGHRVAVYPSILQMKKYALFTVSKIAKYYGVKKMRRLGHSYEFEQIKDYVRGDDLRHLNWKATGRTNVLKTNHFTDERAQPVYCIIDKSRVMNMAFDGLTLLDYAINASLVISNTVLQKGDRAGLITFSDKVGTAIRADNSPGMLRKLLDNLYMQKYRSSESDYEFLFNAIRRVANTRSLLFLFANFESIYALQRVLPVLRKINNNHLLVVIFFENAEVEKYAYEKSTHLHELYSRSIARQMVADKRQMAYELQNHGISCLVTKPEELTINTLNKYLELKSKGLI